MPRRGRIPALAIALSLLGVATSAGTATLADLEVLQRSGDLAQQRQHGWGVLERVTRSAAEGSLPAFDAWHGEDEALRSVSTQTGMRGFTRGSPSHSSAGIQAADASVLTYTFFNQAAFDHIRLNRLNRHAELQQLQRTGPADTIVGGARSVAPFPKEAVIIKTVWWPVAASGLTPLPLWDPELNPPNKIGNDYTSWRRVVAVDPGRGRSAADEYGPIEFAGSSFANARRVGLDDFFHFRVDEQLAQRLMNDHSARKGAMIALGRELRSGDFLIFVAGNVATKEIPDWVWLAFWWHDRPDTGPYAAGRPATLSHRSAQFLMQVAFDATLPLDANGQPHVCFNPWLEARFPDGGQGGGTVSNCMACHGRASFPAEGFLPVTRGAGDLIRDHAYAPDKLRTNFLWTLPLHALH